MSVVRWGMIGAGDIARKRIAPAMLDLPNCELASVSRSKVELAQGFAREFGIGKWFGDWREQIADPEIDAVYIATPVYLHAEQTIAAAEAGKHVLCEKPMALSVAECDRMFVACQANNIKLGVAYYRRFYPVLGRIKEIIASGLIGRVTVVQINAFEYFDPSPDDPRHWLLEREKSGGGPMIDFGCHRLEILNDLFGPVKRIESLVSKDTFDREVEDAAAALMQFDGGECAVLTVTHAASEPRDSLEVFGTKGTISISVLNSGHLTIKTREKVDHESHPPDPNFHKPLIDDFAEGIIYDREPTVSGEDGRNVARMIEEIYKKGW